MATTILGDGVLYTEYPVLAQQTTHFTRVIVDNGDIQLDKASHSGSNSHLFLKGDLQSHEAFVKIENSNGAELLRIDHQGKLHAPVGIVAPEISTLTNGVTSNNASISTLITTVTQNTNTLSSNQSTILNNTTTTLTNSVKLLEVPTIKANVDHVITVLNAASEATELPVDGSLVKRKNTGYEGTYFELLTVNKNINVGKTIAQYGNANYQWIPQTIVNLQPVNDPKAIVRIGRNHEEIGQSSIGDGVEIMGLLSSDGIGHRNNVLITANENAPSIEMVCNKKTGAPWIRLRDHHKNSQIEISQQGLSQSLVEDLTFSVSPNVAFSTVNLHEGMFRLNFVLSDKWDSTSNEMVLKIQTGAVLDARIIASFEVFIDESNITSNYIESNIYIDHISKNVRKNVDSFIRLVLKCELHAGETEIPSGTRFVVTINNQTILL